MADVRYVVFVEGKGYVKASLMVDYDHGDEVKPGMPTFSDSAADITYFEESWEATEYIKEYMIVNYPTARIFEVYCALHIISALPQESIQELYSSEIETYIHAKENYDLLKARADSLKAAGDEAGYQMQMRRAYRAEAEVNDWYRLLEPLNLIPKEK